VRFTAEVTSDGVHERQFEHDVAGRGVPGVLWTPTGAAGPRPLLLIGHGASGSKREGYVVSLARRVVRHRGFAAAAIDGPVHGDRRADKGAVAGLPFLEFSQLWAGEKSMTDAMVGDWRSTLDALQGLDEIGAGPAGYWGLSMGTILGLPFVAAEPRITAAVLGLMGLTGPTRARIGADAARITCAVLFLVQHHDELFSYDRALELFEAIGSEDKSLHVNPGRHGAVPVEEFEFSERFVSRHLGG